MWHAQMRQWHLWGCEVPFLLLAGTALLSFICFLLSGLYLYRRIKKYGMKHNVFSALMVAPHLIFPALVLQEFYRLPVILRLLGESILFSGIVLWIMIFVVYTFWLEYQYQKQFLPLNDPPFEPAADNHSARVDKQAGNN
jgi:hypothetical protein